MFFQIPRHLKKYLVPQNYKKYTPEDQAVWRYIMKGIQHSMSLYGQKGCLSGMKRTDITFEKIPRISNINKQLKKLGWKAINVSGFIPPKAFMEFQLNGILPIASEIRSINHISYTPAPDIVHEAAGHVPFLIHKKYSDFLKQYAKTVLKSISSIEDQNLYLAIRELSDLKENPKSTNLQIKKAQRKLKLTQKNISYISESSYLSRFIWWTSEYGLIGDLKNPKIYGAGLISSIKEAHRINKAKKLWLSKDCLNYPFDITKVQPQYFVAKNFSHLLEVLNEITETLSWKRGGIYGAQQAIKSKTINTVEFDNHLQLSGVVEDMLTYKKNAVFLKLSGPTQISYKNKQLSGHGKSYHSHGYSTPLRIISKNKKPFHLWNHQNLKKEGLILGKKAHLCFENHIHLEGEVTKFLRKDNRLLIITFKNCLVKKGNKILFHPSWGLFDLITGTGIKSVFSGPADQKSYKAKDDFKPSKVPHKRYTKRQKQVFKIYKKIERLKNKKPSQKQEQLFNQLLKSVKKKRAWLLTLEFLELVRKNTHLKKATLRYIKVLIKKSPADTKKYIREGLPLYK